ncbi:MAG: preprotein translocase subunit SecG [Candidatus Synoicihabitans palmerolidicus]|nr:preprotein translocase subunit SecG [Candidatus Synoicihabitans palmerolidicus]
MELLIVIFTFVLILVSLFLVLVVLMQKAKNDGGMGAALGGAEATFGADTGNVLTKGTINAAVAFFVLSLLLYLGHIYVRNHAVIEAESALPTIESTATTAPADDIFAPATMEAAGDQPADVVPEAPVTAEPQP